jgi:hypothetical protein
MKCKYFAIFTLVSTLSCVTHYYSVYNEVDSSEFLALQPYNGNIIALAKQYSYPAGPCNKSIESSGYYNVWPNANMSQKEQLNGTDSHSSYSRLSVSDGMLLLYGSLDNILSSKDGMHWSPIDSPTHMISKEACHYAGEYWVASGEGLLLHSADGKSWSKEDMEGDEPILQCISSANQMLAISPKNVWLFSEGSKKLISTTFTGLPAKYTYEKVWMAGNVYFLRMHFLTASTIRLFKSTDLKSWEELSYTGQSDYVYYEDIQDIAGSSNGYIFIGVFKVQWSHDYCNVLFSKDGLKMQVVSVPIQQSFNSVCYDGQAFYIGGRYRALLRSTDGVRWELVQIDEPIKCKHTLKKELDWLNFR